MKEADFDSNNKPLREGYYHHVSELALRDIIPGRVIRQDNEFFLRYEGKPLLRIYPNNSNENKLQAQELTEIKKGTLVWLMQNSPHGSFLKKTKEPVF